MSRRAADELTAHVGTLVSERWVQIWAPGGRLDVKPPDGDGRSFDGEVVVETKSGTYAIYASATDMEDRSEVFTLCVCPDEVGSVESERRFHPRRRIVDTYPEALPLDRVLGHAPRSAMLVHEPAGIGSGVVACIFEFDAMRFAFWADDELPLSVAASCADDVVAGIVAGFATTRISRTEP